jgi:hypothetical protein
MRRRRLLVIGVILVVLAGALAAVVWFGRGSIAGSVFDDLAIGMTVEEVERRLARLPTGHDPEAGPTTQQSFDWEGRTPDGIRRVHLGGFPELASDPTLANSRFMRNGASAKFQAAGIGVFVLRDTTTGAVTGKSLSWGADEVLSVSYDGGHLVEKSHSVRRQRPGWLRSVISNWLP